MYLPHRCIMPIWCNALSFLNKLLGTALFCSSCFFLHVVLVPACNQQRQPTALKGTQSRATTLTVDNIYGRTTNTHRRGSTVPIPCLCIHDIAGAQQKHRIGLGPHKFAIITCVWFMMTKPGATRDLTRAACERARQKRLRPPTTHLPCCTR